MARITAYTAVTRATRRPNWDSAFSFSSSRLGSSTSCGKSVARPPLRHLLAHRRAARLEGGGQLLRLLLEVLAPLVEEIARLDLRLLGGLLRLLQPVAAVLGQQLARLAPGLGRQQQRRRRAGDGAEEEPPEISCRVASTLVRHSPLLLCRIVRGHAICCGAS